MAGSWTIALLQAASIAQPAPPADEAVVIGERVPRKLREIASSVELFDARRLAAEAGADRLDQLVEASPNVQQGQGSQGPTIRGQDSTGVLADLPGFLGGARPRVTLSVDGRAVGFNEFLFGAAPLWDVAQVEVLRSPQSTVQGRNSIAGAIVVTSRSPRFVPEAAGRAMAGNDGMRQASAMVGGPLVDGLLAFRLAVDARRIRPASAIADTMRGAEPDEDRYALMRFKLLATPAAGSRIEATLARTTSLAPQVERVVAPFRARRDPAPGYGVFGGRATSLTLRGDQRLSKSLVGQATLSAGAARFRRFAPRGVGEAINRTSDQSIDAWLDWTPVQRLRISGGVHALHYALDQAIDLSAIVGTGGFRDRQSSLGLFGELRWRPRAPIEWTAGGRWQRDSQNRVGAIAGPNATLGIDYQARFGAFLPKLSVRTTTSERWTVGALVQRASNPGGTSLNFDTGGLERFDAETLWSAEAFARWRNRAGTIDLSANLFRNWHRDAQRAEPRQFRLPDGRFLTWFRLYNVPHATSEGAEFSGHWQASPGVDLRLGLGLLGTRIAADDETPALFAGKSFQRAPKMTASAEVSYRPVRPLQLSLQLRRHSRYFSNDANTPALAIGAGTRLDASARWRIGRLSVEAYARNLLNDFQLTYRYSATNATALEPRRIGVGLALDY